MSKESKPAVVKWAVTGDAKVITAMQRSINTRSSTLAKHRAILAASCYIHMLETGNATPMTRFVKSASDDVSMEPVVKWAEAKGVFKRTKVLNPETNKMETAFGKGDDTKFNAEVTNYNADKAGFKASLVEKNAWVTSVKRDPLASVDFLAAFHGFMKRNNEAYKNEAIRNHKDSVWTGFAEAKLIMDKYPKVGKKKAKKTAEGDHTIAATEPVDGEVHVH